jgi:uncharacterized damage-inducible protein DinB
MQLSTPLKYKAWADRRTLDAVAQLDQTMHSVTLDFVRQQFNHMVRVEEIFRARLCSTPEPHQSTNTIHLPDLEELDARLSASNLWLQEYGRTLRSQDLDQAVCFTFVDGQTGSMSKEEILYHLINHGTYHRGAIGHALDLAKVPRPADTYTVFVHCTQPHRRVA